MYFYIVWYENSCLCRCEYRSRTDRAHLILRNLQEFDLGYLKALLTKDVVTIAIYEGQAKIGGYGPLVPCSFTASASEHRQHCRAFQQYIFLSVLF